MPQCEHKMLPSVLLVDDDDVLRNRLGRAFRERGYEVRLASDHTEAVHLAQQEAPEWAVVDLRMPGENGLTLVQALKQLDPTTQIVVLTGYGSIATAIEAIRLGATHYLPKPADLDDILASFARNTPSPNTAELQDIQAPSLARAEWEHINRVLADSDGNISEAARRLGIHRRSLQRKLHKHPVNQ